jgi:hypothetical protein
MSLTTDPKDPRLGHGADSKPVAQNEVYLVLTDEERAKGFVRPVRKSYVHVGPPKPRFPLRPLTAEERENYHGQNYVAFEDYAESERPTRGKFWTQEELDRKGCGALTTMALAIAETYARQPHFYGSTYCVGCRMHRPVGRDGEFVWDGTNERVGT